MTIFDVEKLLIENALPFEQIDYKNEADFFAHIAKFSYLKNASNEKVYTLVIYSNNKKKNIEIQFDKNFVFVDLYFGEFSFEMFECSKEALPKELIDNIKEIMNCKVHFIVKNNLKKQNWAGDAAYFDDITLPFNDFFDYEKAVRKIEGKKSFIERLFHTKKEYEIYDWNNYRSIIK